MKITSLKERLLGGSSPSLPNNGKVGKWVKPAKKYSLLLLSLFLIPAHMQPSMYVAQLEPKEVLVKVDPKQLNCLAKNIYYESRGEPEAGQFLVGFVTKNRVDSPKWEATYCKVVKQYNQFEWYSSSKLKKNLENDPVYKKIKEIARIVYLTRDVAVRDYGYYFKRTDRKSKFFTKLRRTNTVGNHSFYTEKDES